MSFRDISLWVRSAKTDSLLERLRRSHGNERAFDQLYRILRDPWWAAVPHYRYQSLKYRVMLSLLPPRNYRTALDIGCGLGVFSRLLAERCDQVTGIDISQRAVDSALQASADFPNVQFRKLDLLNLDSVLLGKFDLVVLADTIYYLPDLSEQMLQRAREKILQTLTPGGILMVVNHYLSPLDSHSRTVRRVHHSFGLASGMRLASEHRRPFYLVSLFERMPANVGGSNIPA